MIFLPKVAITSHNPPHLLQGQRYQMPQEEGQSCLAHLHREVAHSSEDTIWHLEDAKPNSRLLTIRCSNNKQMSFWQPHSGSKRVLNPSDSFFSPPHPSPNPLSTLEPTTDGVLCSPQAPVWMFSPGPQQEDAMEVPSLESSDSHRQI